MEIMEGNIVHQMKVNVRRQDSTEHMEVSLGKDCVNNKQRPAYVTMLVRLLFYIQSTHILSSEASKTKEWVPARTIR